MGWPERGAERSCEMEGRGKEGLLDSEGIALPPRVAMQAREASAWTRVRTDVRGRPPSC